MSNNPMKNISTISRNSPYIQGIFKPIHPEKYIGDVTMIIFRSNLERIYMKQLDKDPNVLKWNSEDLYVPYKHPLDQKIHRYFIDFLVLYKNINGKEQWVAVEIKPSSQIIPPKIPKRKTKRYLNECITYEVNCAKWKYAEEFCRDKGWLFIKVTEKDLISKKG